MRIEVDDFIIALMALADKSPQINDDLERRGCNIKPGEILRVKETAGSGLGYDEAPETLMRFHNKTDIYGYYWLYCCVNRGGTPRYTTVYDALTAL